MNALYYPFHLCHERTLDRLLKDYQVIHFRDFMALQLTPMMGTTAFPDRMGDYYPDFLKTGRIAQGYNLNGAIKPNMMLAVDQDLADSHWRCLFQESMLNDPRFQRGLFACPIEGTTQPSEPPNTPEWLQFTEKEWVDTVFDVKAVQTLSHRRLYGREATQFEYGWALIKTSVSLLYTIELCQQLDFAAATDSSAHHLLLTRTCQRDGVNLENIHIKRKGY